jgi:hypothetical protein
MKTERLDIVIPLKINGDNDDLRYCLRAIAQNVQHRKIWIVGQIPAWVTGVEFIEVPFDPDVTKYRRINNNLRAAINHPGVSRNFIRWDDDMFALRHVSHIIPTHNGTLKSPMRDDIYGQSIDQTIAALSDWGITMPANYELHVPMIFNKATLRQIWDDSKVLQYRSYYGNCLSIGGWPLKDNKVYRLDERVDLGGIDFISTSNKSFQAGAIGKQLRALFSEKCRFES